jgi:MoaA/NifB/PqqE/SkfB family radical SAM enzyme
MQEWSSPYNPFNSMKILTWREHLEGCAKNDFLPPITIDIDPSGKCNLDCIWCNFADYNKENRVNIPTHHLLEIADFVTDWGVKSVHVLGGGEPLMNLGTYALLRRLRDNGIPAGMITNGVLLNDEINDIIAKSCRWIGISVDCASAETYTKVKNIKSLEYFDVVINNIRKLCDRIKELSSKCSVCYKYLLHPENAHEIFKAAELAKSLGVYDFHVRPAGWVNISNKKVNKFDFTGRLESIEEQISQALLLESETFHVYGIKHKFTPDKQRKINYSKCCASPVILIFGADGNCHICGDRRGQKEFILCPHSPNVNEVLKYWNTEKHKEIIQSVKLNECPRCVLGPYHEIVEKVIIRDDMCRCFI